MNGEYVKIFTEILIAKLCVIKTVYINKFLSPQYGQRLLITLTHPRQMKIDAQTHSVM